MNLNERIVENPPEGNVLNLSGSAIKWTGECLNAIKKRKIILYNIASTGDLPEAIQQALESSGYEQQRLKGSLHTIYLVPT